MIPKAWKAIYSILARSVAAVMLNQPSIISNRIKNHLLEPSTYYTIVGRVYKGEVRQGYKLLGGETTLTLCQRPPTSLVASY